LKFVGIGEKLTKRISVLFLISFVVVLSAITILNTIDSQANLKSTETQIRDGLVAKGKTLVNNNSISLIGLAEDNAFSAIINLVTNTVEDDVDIVYGVFMDADSLPWVKAESGVEASREPPKPLEDEVSVWAASLTSLDFKLYEYNGEEAYEFAAPVISEGDILGFIRYGVTTSTMKTLLEEASQASKRRLMINMAALIFIVLLAMAVGIFITRRVAKKITTPLNILTRSAETIAGGDYSEVVDIKTNDEIGILSSNFEKMRATINKKMADLAKLNSTGEQLALAERRIAAIELAMAALSDQIGFNDIVGFLVDESGELELASFCHSGKPEDVADVSAARITEAKDMAAASGAKDIYFYCGAQLSCVDMSKLEGDDEYCVLRVPLMMSSKPVGLIHCIGKSSEVSYETSDQEFVSSIARSLVITLKNIQMLEVIEEQNRTLEVKVEERTAELAEKTNDIANMMCNMHQGLFTVMEDGTIHHEYSTYLEEIMGTKDIAGNYYLDFLFDGSDIGINALDQVRTAVESLIGSDEMMFDFNAHLLVKEITKTTNDEKSKILELDWDPIIANEEIDKIMVTVRDVTELKALERAAEQQKEELEIIGHILAVGAEKFQQFSDSARDLMGKCRDLIAKTESKDLEIVALLFRYMHTIKGNARTYGFDYITNSVHNVESSYDILRKDEESEWNSRLLFDELDQAEKDVDKYRDLFTSKLGSSLGSGGGVDLDMAVVADINASMQRLDLKSLGDEARVLLEKVQSLLGTLGASPLSSILEDVVQSAKSIALELGREGIVVNIDDGDLQIKDGVHQLLTDIFMHVFRNAVDHGIEPPEEREKAGKPLEGKVEVDVSVDGDTFMCQIRDDGRGVALNKLLKKAIECGMYSESDKPSRQEIANLMFSSGLSTAEEVSQVSGRGVGMDAVRGFLEEKGGSIDVMLDDGAANSDFVAFSTLITLPMSEVSDTHLSNVTEKVA